MKITVRDSRAFVTEPTLYKGQPVVGALIYGADRGQVRQRLQHILQALLPDPNDPFQRVDLACETVLADPVSVADELASISMFGDRRVVVIRDASDKLAAAIQPAVEQAGTHHYLAVTAEECGPRSTLRKLFESDKRLAALPCYQEEGRDRQLYIEEALKTRGFSVDRETIAYLAQHITGDRMTVESELERLALYHLGEQSIPIDSIRNVLGDNSDQGVDGLCHAVAAGQLDYTARLFDRLQLEGTPEVVILRALHRHFSRLWEIQQQMRRHGRSVEEAVKALRPPVFFKDQPRLASHTRRWNTARINRVLQMTQEAERDSKRGGELGATLCAQTVLRIARAAA